MITIKINLKKLRKRAERILTATFPTRRSGA